MLKKGGALPTQKQRFCLAKNAPADLHYIATSCRDVPAHLVCAGIIRLPAAHPPRAVVFLNNNKAAG
jgi:hypothetical protein